MSTGIAGPQREVEVGPPAVSLTRGHPPAGRNPVPEARDPVDATFFRDLIWNMQNGVVAIDRRCRLVAMNAVAYRILGLRSDGCDLGRPIRDVLASHPALAGVLVGAFEVSELPNRAELRLQPLDRVLGYTVSLVRDAAGSVVGAALIFKDLTLVEQLEERERLRDRLAALGEMAAAIAHEVKNPLAGIQVMAGVLRRELHDRGEAQSALSEIIREAESANAIVVKVLEFVRPVKIQAEPVRLDSLLADAVASATRQTGRDDVSVQVDVPSSLVPVRGDAQLLHQLFTNLVTNAYEAVDPRGTVSIRVWAPAADQHQSTDRDDDVAPWNRVSIEVADDGPGIAPDLLDRIFSPFFTTKAKGSGLGLSLARKIVDAHGGRVEVTTPTTGGTRFRVLLPLRAAISRHEASEA